MRQDERLGGDGSCALDEVVGAVGGVDDAEPVAGADHLGPKVRQSAMHWRFGLNVTEIIDPIVGQLQVAQPIRSVGLIEELDRAV